MEMGEKLEFFLSTYDFIQTKTFINKIKKHKLNVNKLITTTVVHYAMLTHKQNF